MADLAEMFKIVHLNNEMADLQLILDWKWTLRAKGNDG